MAEYKCKCGDGPFVENDMRQHIFKNRKDPKGTHGWIKIPQVAVATEAIPVVVSTEDIPSNGSKPEPPPETVADKIKELEDIASDFNIKLVNLVSALKDSPKLEVSVVELNPPVIHQLENKLAYTLPEVVSKPTEKPKEDKGKLKKPKPSLGTAWLVTAIGILVIAGILIYAIYFGGFRT